MERCHIKGEQGDRLHAVLCAAGYNVRWLLRMIAKKGLALLWRVYLRPCAAAAMPLSWPRLLRTLAGNSFKEQVLRLGVV